MPNPRPCSTITDADRRAACELARTIAETVRAGTESSSDSPYTAERAERSSTAHDGAALTDLTGGRAGSAPRRHGDGSGTVRSRRPEPSREGSDRARRAGDAALAEATARASRRRTRTSHSRVPPPPPDHRDETRSTTGRSRAETSRAAGRTP